MFQVFIIDARDDEKYLEREVNEWLKTAFHAGIFNKIIDIQYRHTVTDTNHYYSAMILYDSRKIK